MMLPLFLLKETIIEFSFLYMNKDEVSNLLKNANFREKSRILWNIKTFLSCIEDGKKL